nr:alpha/beta fold hydrolase [Thiobaca trueperi]
MGDDPDCLAIDLPGHGDAPDPTGGFEDAIQRLLERLPDSIDRLVGYSLGGRIALGLMQAAPRRFRAATIISAHPGLTDPLIREQRRAADDQWIQLLRLQGIEAFVHAWERQPLFASQRRLPSALLDRQRARRLSQRAEGLARSLECFGLAGMPSLWDDLAQFSGQLRWIAGSEDPKFLYLGRQVAEQRPATDLRILDGVGHNPILEAPAILPDLFLR